MNEFYHLLGNPAHWAFEILVSILFDVVLVGIFYPMLHSCWRTWRTNQYEVETSSTRWKHPAERSGLGRDGVR